jgi:dethiobiotin synthetase
VTVRLVVTGTDTGVGKTVFAAGLTQALGACYWKPVQSGLDGPSDAETVQALTGLGQSHILPEAYRLALPASPHLAAAAEGITIDTERLIAPYTGRPLVIEGAGGPMVPLTDDTLFIDIFARWQLPIILCARTALGTINHSLLAIEALRHRNIPLLGIAFIGDANPDSEETITRLGQVRRLGRLPCLSLLDSDRLAAAFRENFGISDFLIGDAAERDRATLMDVVPSELPA